MKKTVFLSLVLTFIYGNSLWCIQKTLFLDLKESVNRGLSLSFEYKKAKMTDKLYEDLSWEYLREYFPKLGVGMSFSEERVVRGADSKNNKIDFNVEQLIYDGGRISQAREISKVSRKINSFEISDIEKTTKMNVISSYLKILSIEKKISMQKEFISHGEKQLSIAAQELELGEITKLDYLEILTRVEEEKYSLKTMEKDLEMERSSFKILIKLQPDDLFLLNSEIMDQFKDLKKIQNRFLVQNLMDLCLLRRKEIAKTYLEFKKAEKEFELVQKSYIPTISLIGNYSLNGETFPPRDKSYSVGMAFTFSLGGSTTKTTFNDGSANNGRNQFENNAVQLAVLDNLSIWGSQYLEKNLKLLEIMNQREALKKQLYIEIEAYYKNLVNSVEAYSIGKKKTALIDERVKLSRLQLELGELKRVDLIKVELEFLKNELENINQIMNFVLTGIQLEVKIGVPIGYLGLYQLDI